VAQLGGGVGHTVAEVQGCAVAPLAIMQKGAVCGSCMFISEVRDTQVDFGTKPLKDGACKRAMASRQDNKAFGDGGR